MSKNLATTFALTAAALFLGGCGKDAPPTTAPTDATAAPADAAAGDAEPAPPEEAAAAADDGSMEVKCFGINECKGESLCDVEGAHDCGGQNECKGKGWIKVAKSDCEAKGGEIL